MKNNKDVPNLSAGRKGLTPYPLPASNLQMVTIVLSSGRRPGSCFGIVRDTNENATIF
jgi:hypothetical protein